MTWADAPAGCGCGWRRRHSCPQHGVVTEAVPFARPGPRFTSDFEDVVLWLVARLDKPNGRLRGGCDRLLRL